jgi:hypothetical protein
MATIQELVDAYTWCTISADLPDWYICPIYKAVLGEEEDFEKICSETPLAFPHSLLDVLRSSTPPSVDFFRSLLLLNLPPGSSSNSKRREGRRRNLPLLCLADTLKG